MYLPTKTVINIAHPAGQLKIRFIKTYIMMVHLLFPPITAIAWSVSNASADILLMMRPSYSI